MKEIETKILEFDERELRRSLRAAKAKYMGKSFLRRYIFDIKTTSDPDDPDEFVRVRTDGRKSTLTYKFRKGGGLRNTDEVEVEVGDFDKTVDIVSKLWKGRKTYYQENVVEKWIYKGAEVAICTWPKIKPFVEVEAESERKVRAAIGELGIMGRDVGNSSLAKIFIMYGRPGEDAADLRF